MFRRNAPDISSATTLGACGYPKSFIDALAKLDGDARKSGEMAALAIVSIDNLAMIMSGYSMTVAEAVMDELFAVISTHNPKGLTARVQRDQFGVLLPQTSEAQANQWCEEISTAIRSYSYSSRYGELHCLITTAHQLVPDKLSTPEEILGRAIVNLTDKENGDEHFRLDISGAESREEMGMANFLGQAVQEGRIKLAYQPVIDSKTGKVAHYEALLRLFGEDGKISSAGTLIPIAERMGFIPMIDKLVLSKIIEELRADNDVSLALNVSNLTTLDHGYYTMLAEAIAETPGIGPRLIIELTETAAHGDLKHMARFCAEVQALGCLVALDDFGAGYTSFRQLKALSVDMVKIDGAFIRDLTDNADSRFFVKTLLDFTRGFGLHSVAEFVENGEIAKMLMELGVDMLQGYYFAKPLNYRPWLKEGEYKKD
jgi:EAL domain-containing protein (putative c-di-GMP-specific phosphodiesterase class I)/GGDEF domain-containing protein